MIEHGFEHFTSHQYLQEYYGPPTATRGRKKGPLVSPENYSLLRFLAEHFTTRDLGRTMADVGGGPTVYGLISPGRYVGDIHFSDYSQQNLDEVEKWVNNTEDAFNWDDFIKQALYLEGKKRVSTEDINRRASQMRAKISRFQRCDITQRNPLIKKSDGEVEVKYDIVSSNFVAESITDSKREWAYMIENVSRLVSMEQGSSLILSSLLGAEFYNVHGVKNRAVPITSGDIITLVDELGFSKIYSKTIPAHVTNPEDPGYEGYKGISIIRAFREG